MTLKRLVLQTGKKPRLIAIREHQGVNMLSQDVLLFLFHYLPIEDLLAMRLLNRDTKALVEQHSVWMNRSLYKFPMSFQGNAWHIFLQRSQLNFQVRQVLQFMTEHFHLLPSFYYLQQQGLGIVEYCKALVNRLPKYEHLTLKYYATKAYSTILRLFYMDHFTKDEFGLKDVLYVGFMMDFDKLPYMADDYMQKIEALTIEARDTCTTPLELIKLFFGEWGFQVSIGSVGDTCLDQCIDKRKGVPILLCILLMEVGKGCGFEMKPIGFPAVFLLEVEVNHAKLYLDPFVYRDQQRLVRMADLQNRLEELRVPRSDYDEILSPVDYNYVVERCLNNSMLYLTQVPIRSLKWFQALYVTGCCCMLTNQREAVSPTFVFEMMESAFCEDLVVLYKQMSHAGKIKSDFVEHYKQQIEETYLNTEREEMIPEFQDTFQRSLLVLKPLITSGIGFDLNDHSAPTTELAQLVTNTMGKIFKRDLLPVKTNPHSDIPFLCDIGEIFYHRKYNYFAVVHQRDPICEENQEWKQHMRVYDLVRKDRQPFYRVLSINDSSNRYVAEENIELLDKTLQLQVLPMLTPEFLFFAGQFFTAFDPEQFKFIKNAKINYKLFG